MPQFAPGVRRPPAGRAPSIHQLALRKLNENAVRLAESNRPDVGKAYPFWYGFIPHPFIRSGQGDAGNPAKLNGSVFSGEGPDGLDVPAAYLSGGQLYPGTRDIIIRMDRDLNFDLLEARYSARISYYDGAGIDRSGKYFYLVGSNCVDQEGFPRYMSHPYKLPIPTYEYLRVSLYLRSGQSRALYGGATMLNAGGQKTFGDVPLPVPVLQGVDDGKNVIRTPHLLAKESVVVVRCSNYFEYPMTVNGYLFGYKVSH